MKNIFKLSFLLLLFWACQSKSTDSVGPNVGTGGSTARFTIAGNYLYVVDNQSLRVFDIKNPINPIFTKKVNLLTVVETIFPYNNNLLIGTQTGMYIFSLSSPESPKLLSVFQHVRSCDPVVAENDIAYVTLRSGTNCNRGQNSLDIVDIKNLNNPILLKSYDLANPNGLGADGNLLFVTQGEKGLTVFDKTNPTDLKILKNFPEINAVDVIPQGGTLIITGPDGILQYDYSDKNNLKLLSKIAKEI
jgi:hypothetical protein